MKPTAINLVPDIPNPSPDYFCTWQTQLYATSGGTPASQREILGEKALFQDEAPFGWAYFYPEARRDLLFVMDDSWDVPRRDDPSYCGSLLLNGEKFPQATQAANNTQALRSIVEKMKSIGWKGLGGWVCAQESNRRPGAESVEAYWTRCLREAHEAGFSYWKVDWGEKSRDRAFRQMLTELGHTYAPRLTIEHANIDGLPTTSDVFRTYDVPAILSIPMTMEKLRGALLTGVTQVGYRGLVNCEDEVYMAAAGGCTMGVMRHPFVGAFPNGRADMSFPTVHRNLKSKQYEVIRATRWHRIAPAFGVDAKQVGISDQMLTDTWRFEAYAQEIETWWLSHPLLCHAISNDVASVTAPAAIARGCSLPTVEPDRFGNVPYIVAARNPNGAFSIATLGRTSGRSYGIPLCRVSAEIGEARTVGVFGEYDELALRTAGTGIVSVLVQDLASDSAVDITEDILVDGNTLVISGELLHAIGSAAQPASDTSESGAVIRIVRES